VDNSRPLICDHCPDAAVLIDPGCEEIRELFVLVRGRPVRRWCVPCWRSAHGEAVARG
jgi:hypothetical protein